MIGNKVLNCGKSLIMPIRHLPLLFVVFVSCQNAGLLEEVFRLPKSLKEVSAVEVTEKSSLIWMLEDSGNKPELYALDHTGNISHTLAIANVTNDDWEDLASDKEGNLYIGNFGNNDNARQDLCIYKIDHTRLGLSETAAAAKTTFYYPEQTEFPPKKKDRIYDSEAFFVHRGYFYLFTKNRSSKFDGTTTLYRVPNREGNFAAQRIGQFKTCDNYNHCAITSADISFDGRKVALLSADKVWLFDNFKDDAFLNGNVAEIGLGHFSQKEGICFTKDGTLLVTDEKDKETGGYLYKLKPEAKPKK